MPLQSFAARSIDGRGATFHQPRIITMEGSLYTGKAGAVLLLPKLLNYWRLLRRSRQCASELQASEILPVALVMPF
jgi:hypothetical protein